MLGVVLDNVWDALNIIMQIAKDGFEHDSLLPSTTKSVCNNFTTHYRRRCTYPATLICVLSIGEGIAIRPLPTGHL